MSLLHGPVKNHCGFIFIVLFLYILRSIFLFSARILRGIRIASRLGFGFTRETARSVINLSFSVLRLDKVYLGLFLAILFLVSSFYIDKVAIFFIFFLTLGKTSDGNELHVSIWFCRVFAEVIMEIRSSRYTITISGITIYKFCRIALLLIKISIAVKLHSCFRLHILPEAVFADVTRGLTCFW